VSSTATANNVIPRNSTSSPRGSSSLSVPACAGSAGSAVAANHSVMTPGARILPQPGDGVEELAEVRPESPQPNAGTTTGCRSRTGSATSGTATGSPEPRPDDTEAPKSRPLTGLTTT